MPEEKDGYKMHMIVPKPTDPEKLKKREELSKRLKEYPNEALKKALEWIQAKKEQGEREKMEENERKVTEVPQEIKDFREKWKYKISSIHTDLNDKIKNKIIEATNKIAPKIEIEPDWSRAIEIKIWWKEYKILDINMETHTDDEYRTNYWYIRMKKDEVELWWMRGDNVDTWKNQKLKEYVKEKQREWFHISKIEEMKDFLNELWKAAWLRKRRYKIAMLIYLTGMCGRYWLSMWDDEKSDSQANSRSVLDCNDCTRGFNCVDSGDRGDGAGLCMMSYKNKWSKKIND